MQRSTNLNNLNLFNTKNFNHSKKSRTSSQRESEKTNKESEGKSTSVMDYNNLNQTFNTMPHLQSSNEYFSEISSEDAHKHPKTVMDLETKIKPLEKEEKEKIDNSEFQGIFDYNHQKSESMSTLQELNLKYNLGLKSFSGFMDSGVLMKSNDDHDQVKVFDSQQQDNLRISKIGENCKIEVSQEFGNYQGNNYEEKNFGKKKFENKIKLTVEEDHESDKENTTMNEQKGDLRTVDKKIKNVFQEVETTIRKPFNLKLQESKEESTIPRNLSYATSFGNLLKEAPKSVDENSSDQFKKRRIEQSQEEWSKKCKSQKSIEEDEDIESKCSNDWIPSALHTDPTTPVVNKRGQYVSDFTLEGQEIPEEKQDFEEKKFSVEMKKNKIFKRNDEDKLHLNNDIDSLPSENNRDISDGVSLKKSKNRPFLEGYLKERESRAKPLSERVVKSSIDLRKKSFLKASQFTKIESVAPQPTQERAERFEVIQLAKNLKFMGNTKNGLFHGEGKIITSNGNIIYKGNFQNGFYSGYGKLKNIRNEFTKTLPNEVLKKFMSLSNNNYLSINAQRGILDVNFSEESWLNYEGFFKKGQKHGVGKLLLKDGRVFEGEFERGQANGYGIMTYFDKKVAGKWKDNVILSFL